MNHNQLLSHEEKLSAFAGRIAGLLLAGILFSALVGCTPGLRSAVVEWWNSKPPVAEPGEVPQPAPPDPAPAPVAVDEIDISTATWVRGANPAAWPITGPMGRVTWDGKGGMLLPFNTEAWPEFEGGNGQAVGLVHVCAEIRGRLYCGPFEWFRRTGQEARKKFTEPGDVWPSALFLRTKVDPLRLHAPRVGDPVYFLASTPTYDRSTIQARTNVVREVWR